MTGAATPAPAAFRPNQTARSIIRQLEDAGFTVTVPAAPYGASWELTLHDDGPWFGTLHVSRLKGTALRIALVWHPTPGSAHGVQERRAEGAQAIRALIKQRTQWGWQPAILQHEAR